MKISSVTIAPSNTLARSVPTALWSVVPSLECLLCIPAMHLAYRLTMDAMHCKHPSSIMPRNKKHAEPERQELNGRTSNYASWYPINIFPR